MAIDPTAKVISADSLIELQTLVNSFLTLNPTYTVTDGVRATGKNGLVIFSQTLVQPTPVELP